MIETTYEGYSHSDLKKLLGKEDAEWFIKGCPIPFHSDISQWKRLERVYEKVSKANLKIHKSEEIYKAPRIYLQTDDLGTKGVFNPADGKTYDSRSAYYQAVKDKGLVIVGNDIPVESKPKQKKIDWEKAVAETLQKTPLQKKRKKK